MAHNIRERFIILFIYTLIYSFPFIRLPADFFIFMIYYMLFYDIQHKSWEWVRWNSQYEQVGVEGVEAVRHDIKARCEGIHYVQGVDNSIKIYLEIKNL
jgi:hypothetical protein